ncbi:hypothetical protein Tco_1137613 [Tanacetum coccineum]
MLEGLNTLAGNPVKEILLKLNLPNHRSILMDSKVTPTKHGRMTNPYSSPRFIANCFNAGYLKMEVKVPDSSDEVLKSKNFKEVSVTLILKVFLEGRSVKVKEFKKYATLKLFKSTNQEMYEHVGPEVTSSQDGNVYKMAK